MWRAAGPARHGAMQSGRIPEPAMACMEEAESVGAARQEPPRLFTLWSVSTRACS